MSVLYKRIEELCSEHGETITSMCKASGASRASLSDLKVGRKQSLSAETLSKIAAHFNGGGHIFASGVRLKDKTEVQGLVDELDKVCKKYKKSLKK